MKYLGPEAYHFPAGPSHTSPCMDPYFRSPAYQVKKEQWKREAGIITGTAIPTDYDHDEKPDYETEESDEN